MAAKGQKRGFKSGGRKKGTPNKVHNDVKTLFQEYGPAARTKIVQLAFGMGVAHNIQLAACKEITDRAYGRATTPIELSGQDGGPIEVEFTFALDNASSTKGD